MKAGIALCALALISCGPSSPHAPQIELGAAWARASLPGSSASAVYLTLANRGTADDALTGVLSSNGVATVHRTSMTGGIMRMRALEALALPAGETVDMRPGGTHLMLTELREPLLAGRTIRLRLRFDKSAEREVEVDVRASSGEDM